MIDQQMQASRQAAQRVHRLVLKCDPVPERLAEQALPYIDQHRLRDPYNRLRTLDGRIAGEAWGYAERDVQVSDAELARLLSDLGP